MIRNIIFKIVWMHATKYSTIHYVVLCVIIRSYILFKYKFIPTFKDTFYEFTIFALGFVFKLMLISDFGINSIVKEKNTNQSV